MKRRKPQTPTANDCLTTSELAAWFRIHPSTVERWGLPTVAPGRYLFAHVLQWCETKRRLRSTSADVPKRHPDCVAVMCGKTDCGRKGPCYVDVRQRPAA